MVSDIIVNIEKTDIDACRRFDKPDVKSKFKKTISSFVNRKSFNNIFHNKKKLLKLSI